MNKRAGADITITFLGDLLVFSVSLWLSLLVRGLSVPETGQYREHLLPFLIVFLAWFLVFFVCGLYDKSTSRIERRLPSRLVKAQILNSTFAVIFFYFIPAFGLTPKTILFIDLVLTLILLSLWRIYVLRMLNRTHRERAVLVGHGVEMDELAQELSLNSIHGFDVQQVGEWNDLVTEFARAHQIRTIILDPQTTEAKILKSDLTEFIWNGVRFLDRRDVYEEIFGKIPLSLVNESWMMRNVTNQPKLGYDLGKRIMDIAIAGFLGVFSLLIYPFVFLAIKIEDGGPIFIKQERIGMGGRRISILKFRSMNGDDKGKAALSSNLRVTKVGAFLRAMRIDEIPQLLNVIKGDISLVGPRPEIPILVEQYEREIPFYNMRHILKPGLSGWAQIYHEAHPHHRLAVEETRDKLSHDLYYVKNRNLWLDLAIALKTIKILASRVGT